MEMGLAGLIKFAAALLFVLALMGGLALLLKKMGLTQGAMAGRGDKRLKLVEILPIDARRRAAIIQCDDEQHLVLLGPTGDLVVKNNITKRIAPDEKPLKNAA